MTLINPVKILTDLLSGDEQMDLETGTIEFSIRKGYIELRFQVDEQHGTFNFQGAHHPNGSCEGEGICKWCGCTLFIILPYIDVSERDDE